MNSYPDERDNRNQPGAIPPGSSEKERSDYLSMINANGNILLNLVNDIIEISKIESNQVDLRESEFSLNKLFEELHCFVLTEKVTKN